MDTRTKITQEYLHSELAPWYHKLKKEYPVIQNFGLSEIENNIYNIKLYAPDIDVKDYSPAFHRAIGILWEKRFEGIRKNILMVCLETNTNI